MIRPSLLFLNGLTKVLTWYLVGVAITITTHLYFGWGNPHAPPPSFLPIIIVVLMGTARGLWNIRNLAKNINRKSNIGELTINALAMSCLVTLIASLIIVS